MEPDERQKALSTPRDSKEPGSVPWCWQTLYLVKIRWEKKTWTDHEWAKVAEEMREHRIWEKIPSAHPYGSEDAMFEAELGVTKENAEREILTHQQAGQRGGRGKKAPPKKAPTTGSSFKYGNNPDYTMARLKNKRGDLYQRVLDGELSVYAASIEAGFRTRNICMPLVPERAAATLAGSMEPADLALLVQLLLEYLED